MKFLKNNIIIILILIVFLVVAQIFRMDIHVNSDSATHIIKNEYKFESSIKLNESDKEFFTKKPYLILYNTNYIHDLTNVLKISDYLKLDYEVKSSLEKDDDLSKYKSIIMLEHDIIQEYDYNVIFKYVENGGRLLYLGNGNLGKNDFLISQATNVGIKKYYGLKESNSIYFETEVLLGLIGRYDLWDNQVEDYNNFEFLDVETMDDVMVHIEEIGGSPLLWEKNLGSGKIMVLNTGRYESKATRALIVGAFSLLQDLFVYPIINSEVIFIDDFPADYKSEQVLIRENYGRDFERFIKEIWWKDILTLINKYNLKFTSAYIQTYNNNVEGPYDYNESTNATTRELASSLMRNNGEICFHGYNHQSLLFNQASSSKFGYKAWANEEKIIESIKFALENFKKIYPNYKFYTYVPPSNMLDNRAIPSLIKAIPTLRTISGIYFGEVDDFGIINTDAMEQEIGVNSYNLVDLPRITSESFLHDNSKYTIASLITTHGLVNHFIHPDDVLDPERSFDLLWDELYKKIDEFFGAIDSKYPWLDKDTASTASEKVKQVHYSDIYYEKVKGRIIIGCDNFGSEISLILVTDKTVVGSTNCSFQKIGFNRYLVKLNSNKGYLEVR